MMFRLSFTSRHEIHLQHVHHRFCLHGRALTKVLSVKMRRMFIACRSCDVSCLYVKYVFIFVLIGTELLAEILMTAL